MTNTEATLTGTIGPHTTGRPDPRGSRRSPRCPGWGRNPKEN